MPVYDYKCEKCGNVSEQNIKLADKLTTKVHCNCGGEMFQMVAPLRFTLSGQGWFGKEGTGTGYEITQRELNKNLDLEKKVEDVAKEHMRKDKENK